MKNISSGIKLALRTIFRVIPPLPDMVQIAITSKCNLRCKMCPRDKTEIADEHMSLNRAKEIIDKVRGVGRIALVGLGEPFCHPQLFEIIEYCKLQNVFVQTTTNGTMMTSEKMMRRVIESGLDSLSFSLEGMNIGGDSGHDNAHTTQYIEKFIHLRNAMGAKTPRVIVQVVLLPEAMAEVPEIVHWADRIGADQVNLSRANILLTPDLARPSMAEETELFTVLATLRKKYSIPIDCLQDQIYPGIMGRLYRLLLPAARLDQWCLKWAYYTYIREDGIVVPCSGFFPKDMHLGNIFDEELRDIWGGAKYQALRNSKAHREPCLYCDNLRPEQRVPSVESKLGHRSDFKIKNI